MKKYRISFYLNGIKHEHIVWAPNRSEALKLGWEFADDVWVEEVSE